MGKVNVCQDPGTSYAIADMPLEIKREALIQLVPIMTIKSEVEGDSDNDIQLPTVKMEPCDRLIKEELQYDVLEPSVGPKEEITAEENSFKLEYGVNVTPSGGSYEEDEPTYTVASTSDLSRNAALNSSNKTDFEQFMCSSCGKCFANICLIPHMMSHTEGRKPHQCSICAKTFSRQGSLYGHLLMHFGLKPFNCSTCNKNFRQHFELKRHMLMHSTVQPFSCSTCKKNFTDHNQLKRHMLMHSVVKPFNCSTCNKNFTENCNLKRHMLMHCGVKSYKCATCNEAFKGKEFLYKHMWRHTEDIPYKCVPCGKKILDKGYLDQHMRSHYVNTLRS